MELQLIINMGADRNFRGGGGEQAQKRPPENKNIKKR